MSDLGKPLIEVFTKEYLERYEIPKFGKMLRKLDIAEKRSKYKKKARKKKMDKLKMVASGGYYAILFVIFYLFYATKNTLFKEEGFEEYV